MKDKTMEMVWHGSPTNLGNARCWYCVENAKQQKSMDESRFQDEIIIRVYKNIIHKTQSATGKVHIGVLKAGLSMLLKCKIGSISVSVCHSVFPSIWWSVYQTTEGF